MALRSYPVFSMLGAVFTSTTTGRRQLIIQNTKKHPNSDHGSIAQAFDTKSSRITQDTSLHSKV